MENSKIRNILMLFVFLCACIGVFFYCRGYVFNEWDYSISDDEITINGYNGRKKNLVIPSKISGMPVVDVNGLKFKHKRTKDKLESVKIPGSVKIIFNSFDEMPKLKSVELGDGIEGIWAGSFRDCDSLSEITIPDSVEKIGTADANDTRCTFSDCDALKNVKFNEEKVELTGCCFKNTPWIESKKNGESYAIIDESVIGGSKAEGAVVIDKGNKIADMTFVDNDKITDVTICSNINSIEFAAFFRCDSLKNVVIEDGVKNIDAFAFDKCPSLKQITIPDSVVSIDRNAFDEDNIKILCSSGSVAQKYAEENGIEYEIVG